MKLQVLVIFLLLACYLEHTGAISCNDAKTCTKSMYVVETCTSKRCECKEPSKASKYGCQDLKKPEVTATSNNIPSSGEFITDGTITLRCNVEGDGTKLAYKWFRDNTEITGTTQTWTQAKLGASHSGDYTCSYEANGAESDKSDAFTLRLISDPTSKANFKREPKLTGIPKKAFDKQVISITCENTPATAARAVTVKFKVEGTDIAATTGATYTYTYDKTKTTDLSCSFTIGTVTLESPAVSVPVSLDRMPAVKITGPSTQVKGKDVSLTCNIDNKDISEMGVKWTWTKGGVPQSKSTKTITVNTDDKYKCKAAVGAIAQESGEFVVTREAVVSTKMTATPKQVLNNGYWAMTCGVDGATKDIKYSWKKGVNEIYGFEDNILQLNKIEVGDAAEYSCHVKVAGIELGDENTRIDPMDLSNTIKPTITSGSGGDYEAGKTYTLTCESDYNSPGVTFVWKKDTVVQTGKIMETLEVKAETTAAKYSCLLEFNGKSSGDSDQVDVVGKELVSVNIYSYGKKVTGKISPLKDTNVELECKATLAAGVKDTVKYEWFEATTSLAKTAKYTHKVTKATTLKCKATLNTEEKTKEIQVEEASKLSKPIITIEPDVKQQSKGATYTLTCVTPSAAKEITYQFKKDTTEVGKEMQYKIESASASNDGKYTCTAAFNTKSATSMEKEIKVGDPGKYCEVEKDCNGKEYTGKCQTTNNRCICAKSYVAKKGLCQSGASAVFASLIGTVLAALLTRLL